MQKKENVKGPRNSNRESSISKCKSIARKTQTEAGELYNTFTLPGSMIRDEIAVKKLVFVFMVDCTRCSNIQYNGSIIKVSDQKD